MDQPVLLGHVRIGGTELTSLPSPSARGASGKRSPSRAGRRRWGLSLAGGRAPQFNTFKLCARPICGCLPSTRRREMLVGMAKLLASLTPKGRWAYCSMVAIVLIFVPSVFGGTIWADDDLRESPEVRDVRAGFDDGLFSIKGLPRHSYSMNVEYEHGTLVPLRCLGTVGFIIKPKGPVDPDHRWIWDSNHFLAIHWSDGGGVVHRYLVERALERGFHVVGVDVGTSLGSPAGAEIYQKFYELIRGKYGLNRRARMIGHSNGGLITLGWAFRHPEQVDRVVGIFPATDLRSWPGVDRVCGPGEITPSGLSYGLDRDELETRLTEFNPIDNLQPLAKAGVKIYHIHGTADDVVPIGPNSEEFLRRYKELGGSMELEIIDGGKHGGPEFYSSNRTMEFLLE